MTTELKELLDRARELADLSGVEARGPYRFVSDHILDSSGNSIATTTVLYPSHVGTGKLLARSWDLAEAVAELLGAIQYMSNRINELEEEIRK